jgi:hypothetical protein
MRVRDLRFLTTAIIIASCGLVAVRGLAFVRYQLATQSLAKSKNLNNILGQWTDQPGVSSLALEEALRVRTEPDDIQGIQTRRDQLTDLLSVRPTAAQSWLALAAVQNSLGTPPQKLVDVFSMSALTGPNEGASMYQRSLLGLLWWESFTADAQARTITDVIGLTVFDPRQLRTILSAKPEKTRAQIRAALESNGCPPKKIENIGL